MGRELENIDLTVSQHKEILSLLKRYLPDTEVWVYGSRIKFTAKPSSDLDMVAFATKEQSLAVANLKEAFEESSLPFRVDFFVWDEVPEQFHRNIEAERVVLQEKPEESDLPEGWEETRLGTMLSFANGKKSPSRENSFPFPVYGSNGIIGKSRDTNADSMSLIIGRFGSYCGSVYQTKTKCWVTDNAIKANAIGDNDPTFLFYLLTSLNLNNWRGGSGQPLLNQSILSSISVKVPDPVTQKAIAHILGSLDDKIELNRRMNETLEAMAQALFKSWFVDFDPVIDNALIAGNPLPEELQQKGKVRRVNLEEKYGSIEAAAESSHFKLYHSHFPSEFIQTDEMGWIPKGWTTQPLYEIANFINGAAYKNFHFTDEAGALPVVKIAEIKNGVSAQTKFTKTELAGKYRIDDGDILFSWSGNPDTSIDTFVWTGGSGWLNQDIFKVTLNSDADRNFVYYQLKLLRPSFAEIARNKQTTGLGHVTAQDMKRMHVTKCPSLILQAFNICAGSLFDRWYSNLLAIKNQSKLRGTLLPKLLSGKMRIPEVEKLIKSVNGEG